MTKNNRLPIRRSRPWIFAGIISLALSGVGVAYQAKTAQQAPQIQWIHVEYKPLNIRLGLQGHLEPAFQATFTAPFDGTVQEKLVDEGQRVERGQVLMRFDTAQLEIQLREAAAALLRAKRTVHDFAHWAQGEEATRAKRAVALAQMSLNDTERKLAETKTLLEHGIVPRMEVDALEQQASALRLDLASAQSELQAILSKGNGEGRQIAQMELTNATAKYDALRALQARRELIAPFSGIITRPPASTTDKAAEPLQLGARVSHGQPLFGLASLEKIKVLTKVAEIDINQLQVGQEVEITGDGFDGLTLTGKISSIGSQALMTDSTGSGAIYEVTVDVPPLTLDQQKRLKLGMSASLSIVTYRNGSAIVLPDTALQKTGNRFFVDYREAEGKAIQHIAVSIGRATTEGVEVFGLKPGYVRRVD